MRLSRVYQLRAGERLAELCTGIGLANYVAKAGDTMTGALTLPAVTGSATQALNLTSGTGQAVNLTAATGSGSGGTVTIDAGKAGTTSGGTGGSLNLNAGGAMPQGGAGIPTQVLAVR